MSLLRQSRDVPPRGDISTFFGERGSKALAPGVIGSGFVGIMGNDIELLSVHNLRLLGLLVEDCVVQRFVFVEDGDLLLGIQADCYRGMAHGIRGT